jgi:hypothetical protein
MRHATMPRKMEAHSFTNSILSGDVNTNDTHKHFTKIIPVKRARVTYMCMCRRNDRMCSPLCMYAYDSWGMGLHATHVEFM